MAFPIKAKGQRPSSETPEINISGYKIPVFIAINELTNFSADIFMVFVKIKGQSVEIT